MCNYLQVGTRIKSCQLVGVCKFIILTEHSESLSVLNLNILKRKQDFANYFHYFPVLPKSQN